MRAGRLEHANLTVSDADRMNIFLQSLLGWHERWRGPARDNGVAIHVGSEFGYIALWSDGKQRPRTTKGVPLNHVGIVVDDLEAAERQVVAAGLVPFGHDDYDPGRRFYFFDWDGIEFEIVSY